ncbi:MAG: hypothetical protein NVS3B26_22320 [Mycobacteriales bacterium]
MQIGQVYFTTVGDTERYPGPQRPMLAAQLRRASEATHAILFDYLRQRGFTDLRLSHFDLFRFPGPHGVTPTQLASHVGLSKQALNPLLNDLEGWGYLIRCAEHSDRRHRRLQLTTRGLELVTTIRAGLDDLEARTRQVIGPHRYQSLLAALASIHEMNQ